jgi:hypothetical protein
VSGSNGYGANGSQPAMPWARLGAASEDRVTSRVRKMVEGLPDWEPLPPGEILIRRPGQS